MASSKTALTFKIVSEPGWRVVDVVPSEFIPPELTPDEPERRYYHLQLKSVGYWGMEDSGRNISPYGGLAQAMGFGGGSILFIPLDEHGVQFINMRRLVSPLETLTDAELIAEVKTLLESKGKK